jgi:L-amino acid N-acyltransferase YncA
MELDIRPVQQSDAAAIVALLNPIILAGRYTAMSAPFSEDNQNEFIRSLPERAIYLAAIEHTTGVLAGIQDVLPVDSTREQIGEISTFVRLDFHRRGVGTRLCVETFSAAKKLGYRKLRATIREDNPLAVFFYVSRGFQILESSTTQIGVIAEKVV